MKYDALPHGVVPIALGRGAAAQYISVSVGLFNKMVSDGRMPQPKQANRRLIWDSRELAAKLSELPSNDDESEDNEWDKDLREKGIL
jgi:hypothetical protein